MSRHTLEVKANTPSGKAILVVGYEIRPSPQFFCTLQDADPSAQAFLWSSLFSLEHLNADSVDEFDEVLAGHGVTVPGFLKKALSEDWVKRQIDTDYYWHEDGTFEQLR